MNNPMAVQTERELLLLIAQDMIEVKNDIREIRTDIRELNHSIDGREGLNSRMAALESERRVAARTGGVVGGLTALIVALVAAVTGRSVGA